MKSVPSALFISIAGLSIPGMLRALMAIIFVSTTFLSTTMLFVTLSVNALGANFPATPLDFKIFDTSERMALKPQFLSLPGLNQNRWPNGIVQWWYNPVGQALSTEDAVASIKKATHTWESVAGIDFVYMGETSQALSNRSDDKLVIGWLDGDTFAKQIGSYSANTFIWWNGQHIIDGEISINAGDEFMHNLDSFQGIMTHELGHAIGLDHSDDAASIMFAAPYHPGEYQKYLRADDIKAAASLYPSECIDTNSADVNSALQITIPVIHWNDLRLSATLNYTGTGLLFSLADYAYINPSTDNSLSTDCHINASLTDDLSLYLPAVDISGEKLMAHVDYLGDGLFELRDFQWLSQVSTEQAASDNTFGAIAWGVSGKWSYTYNYGSQAAASEAALGYCGSGCSVIAEAENTCLALATGSGTSFGWGGNVSTTAAETLALMECNGVSASACKVAVSFCAKQ